MANVDSIKPAADQNRESYADDAQARRFITVGTSGSVADNILISHPDVRDNVDTRWVITHSDGQPDSETVANSTSGTFRRTFNYTNRRLTFRSLWVKI